MKKISPCIQCALLTITSAFASFSPVAAQETITTTNQSSAPGFAAQAESQSGQAATPATSQPDQIQASVSLIGPYIALYDIPKDSSGCDSHNIWMDGAISPVSYKNPPTSSTVTINIMATLSKYSQPLLGTINPNGTITALYQPSGCAAPSFVSAFSINSNSFTWGEWLYGMFFNAPLHKTYATIYNEFYGPNGYNLVNKPGWYSADGLATSTNYGVTFSRLATKGPPPNHVIARPTFTYAPAPSPVPTPLPPQTGYGGISSIVLSPKDNYFYGIPHWAPQYGSTDTGRFILMRTANLDDPSSWRVWSGGTTFSGSFWSGATPVGYDPPSSTRIPITVFPLYLGWNQYFQRFIAVGWHFGPTAQWDFALSDDLIHWDPAIKIMDPPYPVGCTPAVDPKCAARYASFGYPSLVDPAVMLNTADSRAASGNLSGQTPYLAYIHNNEKAAGTQARQELRIQKLQFSGAAPTPTPVAIPNVSIRAIVGTGDKNLIAGFQIVGTGTSNPKTLIIRGIGPSLGQGSLPTPTISLYDGNGTLLVTNHGWTNLSPTNQALLGVLAPSNSNDSAVVYGRFMPGAYTAVLSGGTGLGQIEIYDVTWQSPTSSFNSSLANFSARGYVQSGSGAMILGFIANRSRTLDVRATSLSTLAPAGLSPVLADPTLTFYTGTSQTDYNDNWRTDPDHVVIMNDGLAPRNDLESAFRPPVSAANAYTAVCAGKSNAPNGYALVELYDVSP